MIHLNSKKWRLLPIPYRSASLIKHSPANPRSFTQNSQLLLIFPTSPRPQLPFLHSPSSLRAPQTLPRSQFRRQLARLLTTERKQYIKFQVWLAAKYSAYGWTFLALFGMMAFGIHHELLERQYPSPHCWTWISRMDYRGALAQENPDANGSGRVDWANTGNMFRILIHRLENPTLDGQGLRVPLKEEREISIDGEGDTGLDITSKPEPWRRGYHTALMGAARAAEHLDGWVRDITRNIAFPPEVVIGTSNPRPKPVPLGAQAPPLEENCVPGFESPERYYMKILTTQGFSTRQRLDAALAYANWLDFKGLTSTAEEMYDWGLDVALGALPLGINNAVDIKTGVISRRADYVSSNLLLATTSLAIHHATTGNLSAALPIFLSILRARRNLRAPQPVAQAPPSNRLLETESTASTFSRLTSLFKFYLVPTAFPPAPSDGDDPPERNSAAVCEEAGIMAYIGEILFASSAPASLSSSGSEIQQQSSGLSWTRDAVDLAEGTLKDVISRADGSREFEENVGKEAKGRCCECLEVGMGNWQRMVEQMLKIERAERAAKPGGRGPSRGWFWGTAPKDSIQEESRWEAELRGLQSRARRIKSYMADAGDMIQI